MGEKGGEEATGMGGKCRGSGRKAFHFSGDPPEKDFGVDFNSSRSVCALGAMVTILYLKNQNIVIQVILGYWKRLIFKIFFFAPQSGGRSSVY